MKNIFTITFIFVATLLVSQSNDGIKVPLSNPNEIGQLDIHIHNGSITILGEDRTDVLVKYEVEDDNDHFNLSNSKKNKKGLRKIGKTKAGLEISEDDNNVIIDTDSHRSELDIIVIVPKNFNINFSNHNGDDLNVENISGEINIESHNSDISAKSITGYVNANTYNGDILVEFVNIPSSKDMSFGSYNGDIELLIPSNYNSDFKLKTKGGDILSDLDLNEVSKTPELKSSEKGSFKLYTDTWTYAQLNSGGGEIKINTNNGDILLRANK